ncbi:MAG: adenylyl-sulfate reductase subunit alpha [Herbinix sp.]|jgi:adenylylsulfate reductase subunit A|nr:adenylyl-sulfate reductase subunit alpha [Herbinix sp.]
MRKEIQIRQLQTDILIIGGGTAGCYAALTIREHSKASILIAEKANIKRSGCLAAGVNAINAYIVKGRTPEDYVDYAKKDADSIVREDLLLTMSQGLNRVTKKLEELGLVMLKDDAGEYVARGNRNIKINGENIKPILAEAVNNLEGVSVLNKVNVIDYIVKDNRIYGAFAISVEDEILYEIKAKKVICATGGAAGLYRPNNPGFSRHKMWYPPFNTGAGYAMGIRTGAEMTTFEMRFIALRCKDTIAPTGTIAQGVGAKQINSKGEVYETKYGITTSERVYGTVKENQEGRGPCYLRTEGITPLQDEELKKAYLNMAPSQTLKWMEAGKNPSEQNVELEGTEPYIVGGHTASGYWVDTNRRTTIEGLYAAGDVAGGCPQKYVTGALVEGEIAGKAAVEELMEEKYSVHWFDNNTKVDYEDNYVVLHKLEEEILIKAKKDEIETILNNNNPVFTAEELEEAMQKVMDTYAGGIGNNYQFNEKQLAIAEDKINQITELSKNLRAENMHELMFVYELQERLTVCKSVIAHLRARKETRWHSFAENLDYPDKSDAWLKYVNSKLIDGRLEIIYRDLVGRGETYEHRH